MIKLQSDITELKNKIDYLFRNNIDNDKIKREFKLLNSRKESNNMRYSIPSYHSDNKNIEHEIEQKQNQRIRRLLYLGIRWIIIRSNTTLIHKISISTPKTYLPERDCRVTKEKTCQSISKDFLRSSFAAKRFIYKIPIKYDHYKF